MDWMEELAREMARTDSTISYYFCNSEDLKEEKKGEALINTLNVTMRHDVLANRVIQT